MTEEVTIDSNDFWFKIIEMLQHNWALIEIGPASGCTVYFIHDGSGGFEHMSFDSVKDAETGLYRNGFKRYAEDEEAQEFIVPPRSPYYEAEHPNGPIYSSGRFWR